jgi:DNA-binding MarR family transcriptional regulator
VILLARLLDQGVRQADVTRELGLTDIHVLARIRGGESLPSQIARSLQIERGTVTKIVDRLVARGYVERRNSERDRRRKPLALTRLGGERLRGGIDMLSRLVTSLPEQVPLDEISSALAVLQSAAPSEL